MNIDIPIEYARRLCYIIAKLDRYETLNGDDMEFMSMLKSRFEKQMDVNVR